MHWVGRFAAVVVLGMSLIASPVARGDNGYHGDFYLPPNPLPPGAPGDVIRTEPSDIHIADDFPDALGVKAIRILYRSTNTHDQPVAVSGTYLQPAAPWPGPGPRPLISFAVGTHGQGDQCAPSRLINVYLYHSRPLDVFLEYELLLIQRMIKRGWAVVVTDYIGLGTPGVHTYTVRADEGHAVLDAARAAYQLPDTGLDTHGPLALYGYSQGGGATAAAAELASTYAPELDISGTYAGAPPADLAAELPSLDGSLTAGILGYVINAAIAAYPEYADAIHQALTPDGEDLIAKTQNQCLGETIANFMFRHVSRYLAVDPETAITTEPFRTIFDQQRIGRLKPVAPVLISSNRYDPLVPYVPAVQLGRDWCALGADVQFNTNEEPPLFNKLILNHALPIVVDAPWVLDWVADRLDGLPTSPNCGHF
jgi:hypothetical protein